MSSVNKVILLGRVGKDPEVRQFPSGGQVANFSIATSETWRDKSSGERKERTEWHNVSVMSEGLVRVVRDYVKKGSKLYVEGKLVTRKWADREGNDRYTTEVVLQGFNAILVLLDGKPSGERESGSEQEEFDQDIGDSIPF